MSIEAVNGKTLQTSADLKTQACCTSGDMPGYVEQLSNIHNEVQAKYYGCGFATPLELAGRRVLDSAQQSLASLVCISGAILAEHIGKHHAAR